jgi:outer membrane receptor protein involved in Fe transport
LRALLAVGVSAVALGAFAAPAFAADADTSSADTTTVGEVVVTAQKKEERLQDVPIAVSAFSQDSLEKQKIDGGPNLVLAIPNVNFSKGNFTGYNFQIRGVGSKLVATSGDAGTGIHLNNAPLTANNLFETEFYDVERVEVLRGPQGTLYGRNATGGVVNIITAKPSHDFEASIRGEIGSFSERKFRAMVNVPLGDVFSLRLAGTTLKRDGFGHNTITHNDVDNRDLYGFRATVGFQPSDNFKAYFMYDKFHENDNRSRIGKQLCSKDLGLANVGGLGYSADPNVAQIQRGFFSQGCRATSNYASDILGTVNSQATLGGLFGALGGFQTGDAYAGKMQDPNIRNMESFFDPIYRSSTDIFEFNIDWDLNDNLKLTALSSWSKYNLYTRQDYNRYTPSVNFNTTPNASNLITTPPAFGGIGLGAPTWNAIYGSLFPGGVVSDPQNGASNQFRTSDISSANTKQFTQELRLQSSFDGPINFNVGGIFLDFKATGDYYVMFNTGTAWYQATNAIYSSVFIDPNHDPNRSGHNYYDAYSPYHLKSRAAFGELYYQMTENFKWTLGLRYTDDDKIIENHLVTLGTNGSGVAPAVITGVRFQETTGRFGFDWKPDLSFTNQTLIYAFFSKGYKAGGLNSPCTAGPGVSCGAPSFAPEFVNSFELGTKNTLFDGTLVLNLTGFYYNYKGYQVSKIVNRASTNENIDAKIKGAEFESIWSPVRGLRFNTSVGYLDTEISKGTSIDTFNRTQGTAGLVEMKSSAASNCVLRTADAQTVLGTSNAVNNPFILLAGCSVASAAGAGTVLPGGAIAIGSNSFGGLVSDGVAVNLKGKELPNAPHWTFTFGAQYTMDFGSGWSATLRGDYYKQTKTFSRIYNSVPDQINGWDNINATLTINSDHGFAIEAFVKNATDEKAITDTYLTDDSSGLFRNAFYTEPRTWGLAISQKW